MSDNEYYESDTYKNVSENDDDDDNEIMVLPSKTSQKNTRKSVGPSIRNNAIKRNTTNNRREISDSKLKELLTIIRQQQDDISQIKNNSTSKPKNKQQLQKQQPRIKESEDVSVNKEKRIYQKKTTKNSIVGKTIGTKTEVYEGVAQRTPGGLFKKDLIINSKGFVVSKLKSENAKRNFHNKN